MKVQELLNEDVSQISVLIKLLKRDCGPFLALNLQRPLLRGIKPRATTVKGLGPYIKKGTVRKDRKPSDTGAKVHSILDEFFLRDFGVRARSGSLFTTFSNEVAKDYGENSPYFIFPIGKFSYIWSDIIKDAYYDFDGGWRHMRNEYLMHLVKEVIVDLGYVDESGEPFENRELMDDQKYQVIEEVLKKFGKELYKSDDIKKAQDTRNEIMLVCDEYYAINSYDLAHEFGVSSEELMDALRS